MDVIAPRKKTVGIPKPCTAMLRMEAKYSF